MSILPDPGMVAYYRSMANQPGPLALGTMFVLARTTHDKYMLFAKDLQKNISAVQAQELANMSDFIKKGLLETKKSKKTVKKSGLLESLLFEAESAIAPSETDPVVVQDVSLDQKVDRYLVRYEKEAIPTSDNYEVEGGVQARVNSAENPQGSSMMGGRPQPVVRQENRFRGGILGSILFEAPGDPGEEDPLADPAAAPPPGGDLGGDLAAGMGGDPAAMGGDPAAGGAAPAAPPAPPVIDTPKMNMNNYTRAVSRLIGNYEALLDPKTTILNRAKEYIRVNYDEATATMFEETMKTQYGITATPEQRDQRDAPGAVGAIYGAAGGGA